MNWPWYQLKISREFLPHTVENGHRLYSSGIKAGGSRPLQCRDRSRRQVGENQVRVIPRYVPRSILTKAVSYP